MSDKGTVEVEDGGTIYTGSYVVRRGMLHLMSSLGDKTGHVGGLPPHVLARTMLRELISDEKLKAPRRS